MKDTEDVDVAVVLDEVGDSVMSVEQDAHVARRSLVSVPISGKVARSPAR
jgi:hypothetical protein